MTYALTNGSRQALNVLLLTGGEDTLLLRRADNQLRATLQAEITRTHIHTTLRCKGACHSLLIPRADTAAAQHLADFVEQIVNGVADTAEQPPIKAGPFDQITGTTGRLPDGADMVNHPPHYNSHPSGIECIQVTERLPFNLGNAFKYVFRHRGKNGQEDLLKARWYLQRELVRTDRQGISLGDLQAANSLATQIAAHESYVLGGCMVAIASDEPETALELLGHLLASSLPAAA